MPKPSLPFLLIAGFATAAIAFSAASLMRPSGVSAQESGETAPTATKRVFAPSVVAYIDYGRVVSENKARERDVAKLRREQEGAFFEAKKEIEATKESISADLRQHELGSAEYRNVQKRIYQLEDSMIVREAELKRSGSNDLDRINKRQFDRTKDIIEAFCRAHGISVVLNLKQTQTNDPGRVDIAAKIFDDSVVWFDANEREITDDILAILNKDEAEESAPEDKKENAGASPSKTSNDGGATKPQGE